MDNQKRIIHLHQISNEAYHKNIFKMKQITDVLAAKFKKNYVYQMCGTQTLIFPNGQEFNYDDRLYYSGRGAKYNNGARHDIKGIINITKKEVAQVLKAEKLNNKIIRQYQVDLKEKGKRIAKAKDAGIYTLVIYKYVQYIELSEQESRMQFFDSIRLAATLNISEQDASLLNSRGKTYVFAKNGNGQILELYHPSLSCNNLSISITMPTQYRLAEFNNNIWISAPYAIAVGMSNNKNHFVC